MIFRQSSTISYFIWSFRFCDSDVTGDSFTNETRVWRAQLWSYYLWWFDMYELMFHLFYTTCQNLFRIDKISDTNLFRYIHHGDRGYGKQQFSCEKNNQSRISKYIGTFLIAMTKWSNLDILNHINYLLILRTWF